jgi:hypothetical protein
VGKTDINKAMDTLAGYTPELIGEVTNKEHVVEIEHQGKRMILS